MQRQLCLQKDLAKAILFAILAMLASVLLMTDSGAIQTVQAYSTGPPGGVTGAPGDVGTCAGCHVGPPRNGQFNISAPQTYVPGQTYQITVTHINNDQTRQRWGFELTVLSSGNKAGELQNLSTLTQILDNDGPAANRQYIEHTFAGTFRGQRGGASWTFNWIAPSTDVGTVTFYAAGNQANDDGNTSGDQIYISQATADPAPSPSPTPTPTPTPTASPIQLILDTSGPALDQMAALDSILFLRDPFPVVNGANLFNMGSDRNTRLIIFVTNLQLTQAESSSAVVVNLIDSNNQIYDIAAEDVRSVPGVDSTQVIFRLPDNLPVGTFTIKVKAHGQVSNPGTARIRI